MQTVFCDHAMIFWITVLTVPGTQGCSVIFWWMKKRTNGCYLKRSPSSPYLISCVIKGPLGKDRIRGEPCSTRVCPGCLSTIQGILGSQVFLLVLPLTQLPFISPPKYHCFWWGTNHMEKNQKKSLNWRRWTLPQVLNWLLVQGFVKIKSPICSSCNLLWSVNLIYLPVVGFWAREGTGDPLQSLLPRAPMDGGAW